MDVLFRWGADSVALICQTAAGQADRRIAWVSKCEGDIKSGIERWIGSTCGDLELVDVISWG